jgi:arabinose-5-phosphate isomerase
MVGSKDVVVALSKSGEARELADIIGYAKRFDIPLIAITAEAASPLGRAADVILILPTSSEASGDLNAPTTSTTMQMALGDALAVALLELRGFSAANFKIYHPGGKLGAQLRTVGDLMHGPEAVPLVPAAAPMTETLLVMTERRFGCVGVCDDRGKLIGLITDGGLRRHMDGLLERTAGDVMTSNPLTVSTDLLAAEALNRMEDRRITVLLAVDEGYPVGILHIHDLLRAGVA